MSSEAYALATYGHLLKVMHTCAGLFIWEFLITLDFEWEVYTGRRPWRWSFIVYIAARLLALASIILSLVGFNVTREFGCNVWLRSVLVTSWFAAASASFLLVLRGVAIWGRDTRIVAVTGSFWLANLVGSFYVTQGHTQWVPVLRTCSISGTNEFKWSIVINFVEDFVLLGIMFFGVLHKRNATHLWNMLYFQGLFWILTATLTELPSVALSFQNINDSWNLMFQYPHLTLMVITSSRAYRDLFQYITSDQDSYPTRRKRKPPRMRAAPSGRDVQVTVTKTIEFDVELRLGEGPPALPSGIEDEESGYESHELTKEEQQIRTLELQMKQDLEI
ncbi:hypothetical protein B0F90DRAFT_1668974 [Multifurca ochricompacta]|uniref:Uncharacterized protein n=1 Tax=Multifurca ochricompacta TaxID=376703 RepID=A0AAD4M2D3_9AGAM|nr:hypothetical protein B0F90DRAFT_1668974 [Multifurca ochricompacta]